MTKTITERTAELVALLEAQPKGTMLIRTSHVFFHLEGNTWWDVKCYSNMDVEELANELAYIEDDDDSPGEIWGLS